MKIFVAYTNASVRVNQADTYGNPSSPLGRRESHVQVLVGKGIYQDVFAVDSFGSRSL